MNIDQSTISRIANLARLEVSESEKTALLTDMNNILRFMDKLNELDTDGVEPLIYLTDEVNVYREDVVKTGTTVSEALVNAPSQDGKYFQVAKVIDK